MVAGAVSDVEHLGSQAAGRTKTGERDREHMVADFS
jgi:hypothetical protein